MSTVTVSSSAALQQALASAQSGDTILLAAGQYSDISLYNLKYSGVGVTVTSADPNNMALLSDLQLQSCAGLTFTNLELSSDLTQFTNVSTAKATDPYPFRITNSDRIVFDHLDVHGSVNNDPSTDRNGILINQSTNVTVSNSEIHDVQFGIVHSLSDGITITNNYLHDIRTDGVHGSSSNAVVANNYFTNFRPADGDHPDAIQWFSESTTTSPTNISVYGNVYERGDGGAIEGIFFEHASGTPFTNVNISDNLLIGTAYIGITIMDTVNATVKNNVLRSMSDYNSRIWIGNSVDSYEVGNTAGVYIYGNRDSVSFDPTFTNSNLTVSDNTTDASVVTDGGSALLQSWMDAHPSFTLDPLGSTDSTTPTQPVDSTPTQPVDSTTPSDPTASPGATPSPPSGLGLDSGTDTGVKGDELTKSAVVRIDGQVNEAGAMVMLYSGSTMVASGTADSTGHFALQSNETYADGTHSFYATTKSAGGVVSAASDTIAITVDTIAAQSDLLDFVRTASNRNQSTVSLSGTASDNLGGAVQVDVYRDGSLMKSVSTSNGAWAATDSVAGATVHTYSTRATDEAGNVSTGAHSLVIGTSSNENFKGTAGDDFIWGNGGYDTMTGAGGNDTFVFRTVNDAPLPSVAKNGKLTTVETITDFASGDHLDLSDLGHLAFGGQSTTGHAHTVNWYVSGGNTFVVADVTGDNKIDMMIQLSGNHPLTANDFLLG